MKLIYITHLRLLAILALTHIANAQSGFWHRENIIGHADSTRWHQLAVDAAGQSHAVFARTNGSGGIGIYHAIKSGPNEPWAGSWIVGSTGTGQREQVALVIHTNGRLHISYVLRASGANQLYHASRGVGDSNWNIRMISSSASIHTLANTTIDVSSNGLAAIAYTGVASNELRFASQQSGGGWTDGVANATANTGFAPSINLIGSGIGFGDRVLVSHFDDAAGDLKLSRFFATLGNPPSWTTETVMATGQAGPASAVRRLPDGSIGVAYFHLDGDAMLRFGRKSGATWTHETIDSSAGESGDFPIVGHRLAMTLDVAGAPNITYTKGQFALFVIVTEEIRHARRLEPDRWGIEPIRTGLASNTNVAIASTTNSAGTPQVALFTNFTTGPPAFEWLRPMAGAWVSENLNPLLPNTGSGSPFGATAITHRGDDEFVLIHTIDNFTSRNLRLLRGTGTVRQLIGGFQLFTCDQLAVARPRPGDDLLFAVRRNSTTLDVWAISLTDGSAVSFSNPISGVDAGPIDLALAPDGRLHLVATRSGALSYYRSRNPETPSPSFVFDPVPLPGSPNGAGAAIDISPQGTVAISFHDTAADRLKRITVPVGGAPGPALTLDTPPVGNVGQPTTDVSFDGESPVVAWATLDAMNRSRVRVRSAMAVLLDEHHVLTRVGTVRCKAVNGHITTAWHAVANPVGNIRPHLGYGVCRNDGLSVARLTVAAPIPESFYEALIAQPDAFSLDHDPSGHPKIAMVLRDITPPNNVDYLFLLQPADGLDSDNDGFPLLAESAFAMNPQLADSIPPVTPDFPLMPLGELRHRLGFTHSGVVDPVRSGNRIRVGEFEFVLTHSADLTAFSADLSLTGITTGMDPGTVVSSNPPVTRSMPYLGYPASFRDTNPRHFTRLECRRIHIDP